MSKTRKEVLERNKEMVERSHPTPISCIEMPGKRPTVHHITPHVYTTYRATVTFRESYRETHVLGPRKLADIQVEENIQQTLEIILPALIPFFVGS